MRKCSFREGTVFTVFLLSAGAMDSESRALPVIIFLGAVSMLCWMGQACRREAKRKSLLGAGSDSKNQI